ncbi:hypothetical protein [Variovorax paradoxus]|uniref:hypothetical protein n=1 Tax=Variovorax paradoxus TaxID=34073 RepID=UPI0029C7A1B0|nr:hypothetical protein RZE77_11290 [Variovorax paradoxus]
MRELYSGRAFALASKAAEGAGADLYVLSAGMGFVKQDALVPPYNLSVALNTDDCILLRSRAEPFTASQWWAALHEAQGSRPLAKLLSGRPKAMLVLAATRPYIQMVEEELASLTAAQVARLRIVGPTQANALPELLRPSVMPYDDRLDDVDVGLRGTRFDFAARALTHFVDLVGGDECIQSPQDHAKRVRLSLSKRRAPERLQRERIDAAALRRHVRALKKAGESKTSALAKLRRELGYACEQQRFSSAWEAL